MSFADKSIPRRKAIMHKSALPHAPMGDERFRQLMNEMSMAFAQADDGEERRRQARERERQREQWLAQRQAVIDEIVATMHQHGLGVHDLL
jgi:hypothetical protein